MYITYSIKQNNFLLTCEYPKEIGQQKKIVMWLHKEHKEAKEEVVWIATGADGIQTDQVELHARNRFTNVTQDQFSLRHKIYNVEPNKTNAGYFICVVMTASKPNPLESLTEFVGYGGQFSIVLFAVDPFVVSNKRTQNFAVFACAKISGRCTLAQFYNHVLHIPVISK